MTRRTQNDSDTIEGVEEYRHSRGCSSTLPLVTPTQILKGLNITVRVHLRMENTYAKTSMTLTLSNKLNANIFSGPPPQMQWMNTLD